MGTRIGDVWRAAPPYSKQLSAILWPIGGMLVVVGVYGDVQGFWQNRGFLVNLTSGLTSFCFAIPVALLFLGPRAELERQESVEAELRLSHARAVLSVSRSLSGVTHGQNTLRRALQGDTSSKPRELFMRLQARRPFSISEVETTWRVLDSFQETPDRRGLPRRLDPSAYNRMRQVVNEVVNGYRELSRAAEPEAVSVRWPNDSVEWTDEQFREKALSWCALDVDKVRRTLQRWP
ncbi:hypothetical protein ACFZC6_08145 [Streptomyces ossamyceticus]|uniref:hypothetical protein n=1 Tax=Streptomyces ossamyceticus TaxID=249581 RepID=UPI0036F00480